MSKYTTVIFDLGKVLVEFDPPNGMDKMGLPQQVKQLFLQKIFSGLWESYDGINATEQQWRSEFKKAVPGYEKEVDILLDNCQKLTEEMPYTKQWLTELKQKGYKIYILSNYGSYTFNINKQIYPSLSMADGMVISYEIEKMKPAPEIYQHLINKYNINPQEAIFIDDRKENIEGASKQKITGIVFDNYQQAHDDLNKLLEI